MAHPKVDQQITFLYTQELTKSADFYENMMGFSLWLDQGSCRIYHVGGSSYIGVCQTNDESKGVISGDKQTNIIFTIVTDKVDEWYSYLKERGVEFEKPPETNPKYHIYHCFLRDPNGYLIEIQRFLNV